MVNSTPKMSFKEIKLEFVSKQQNLYFSRVCNIELVAFAANKSLSAAINCTQCFTLIDANNQYAT